MIKIIKKGNPNRVVRRIYKLNCTRCGCEFEFEIYDLDKSFLHPVIKCPCCNIHYIFDPKNTKFREEIDE